MVSIIRSIAGLLTLSLVIVLFSGCSSGRAEIEGAWEMREYRINGYDEERDMGILWEFSGDGRFAETVTYPGSIDEQEGLWHIDDAATGLVIRYTAKNSEVRWKIVRLDRDTLAVEYNQYGFFVERLFVKQ